METNNSGVESASRTYYAYGSTRSSGGTLQTDRTYTGQKEDGTGLHYYNARYYDSTLGVFLSPDTLVPDAGGVIDYNRFLYVRANPLSLNDSTGHTPGGPNFDLNDWGSSLGWGAGLAAERTGWPTSGPERGLEMALRVAPVTGEFIDGVEALSGTDLSTGEPLSEWERGLTVVSMAVPLVPSSALRQVGHQALKSFTRHNFRENLRRLTGQTKEAIQGLEAHHLLPQQFERRFIELGIGNIHDPQFGSWVQKRPHREWSYEYNAKWGEFLDSNPTSDQIINFAQERAKEYGFDVHFK